MKLKRYEVTSWEVSARESGIWCKDEDVVVLEARLEAADAKLHQVDRDGYYDGDTMDLADWQIRKLEAENAELKEKLAELEAQEPVGYVRYSYSPDCGECYEFYDASDMINRDKTGFKPLYAAPKPEESK